MEWNRNEEARGLRLGVDSRMREEVGFRAGEENRGKDLVVGQRYTKKERR